MEIAQAELALLRRHYAPSPESDSEERANAENLMNTITEAFLEKMRGSVSVLLRVWFCKSRSWQT